LEELRDKARPRLQRIGLSATQRPLEEVARLLGGFEDGAPRPVTILDAQQKKPLEIVVAVPDPDFSKAGEIDPIPSGSAAGVPKRRSVWPKVHEDLVARIRAHRTTMVFVNSRRLAERLANALNELAGEELALAHHGSVAREKRVEIEDRLKRGQLPAIVATSSLELGIDMGTVDLVVQIEAPPSVASGLQRIGRAFHQVGGTPSGVILPKHKGDLAACAAATARMREGLVEETFYPRNPLDVLAQQVVAIASDGALHVDTLYARVRRAAPFAELPRSAFDGVLDMLSGRYPTDEFAELKPRVVWDRVAGTVRAREGAQRIAITNGGTIPDRGLYGVFLADGEGGAGGAAKSATGAKASKSRGGKRVGELDEEMVFELHEGEVFLLGASSWRAAEITHDRVLVTP
ncbi:DEAD/DEAH box helicase, partial [bacterium]